MRQVPALDASPFGIVGNGRVARHFQHYLNLLGLPVRVMAARDFRALGFVVDYVEDRDRRRLGAVRLGGVRLIDNVPQGDRQ